jgi:TRAP transporter TAXI family solute receptor
MRRRTLLYAAPLATVFAGVRSAFADPPTVGIIGGEIDGTFMRVATDLTSVLNSDTLRVIPIVGKGSLQNLGDLLHLKGVDLALVAADVLGYAKQANLYPGELQKIEYVCKLYDNDVHVCARPEIRSMSDLNGKPVNIDVAGAGTNLSMRSIFKGLGVTPQLREEEPDIAQARLQRGEIAANAYSAGRPVRLFTAVPPGTNLHFLPIELNQTLAQTYLPGGELTARDYPTLVPPGQAVPTIGVGVTLAVYNWAPDTQRYRNLVTFVDAFFTKFPALLKPPHHPVWHEVNLAAAQPGWVRFKPAADWLAQQERLAATQAQNPDKAKFEAFLAQHGGWRLTAQERDATWRYFRQQMQQRTAAEQ